MFSPRDFDPPSFVIACFVFRVFSPPLHPPPPHAAPAFYRRRGADAATHVPGARPALYYFETTDPSHPDGVIGIYVLYIYTICILHVYTCIAGSQLFRLDCEYTIMLLLFRQNLRAAFRVLPERRAGLRARLKCIIV